MDFDVHTDNEVNLKEIEKKDKYMDHSRGARGVMVIVVGSGHGDTRSNSGRD